MTTQAASLHVHNNTYQLQSKVAANLDLPQPVIQPGTYVAIN